jgi:hypothetical protein
MTYRALLRFAQCFPKCFTALGQSRHRSSGRPKGSWRLRSESQCMQHQPPPAQIWKLQRGTNVSNRVFGLVWCLIIGLLSLRPLLHEEAVYVPLAVVAVLLALIAFAAPGLLDRPNRLWTYFGKKLHAITSAVALFLIYFFFLTPGAVLLRLCGRRQLKLQFDQNAPTYWTERTSGETNFKHPY